MHDKMPLLFIIVSIENLSNKKKKTKTNCLPFQLQFHIGNYGQRDNRSKRKRHNKQFPSHITLSVHFCISLFLLSCCPLSAIIKEWQLNISIEVHWVLFNEIVSYYYNLKMLLYFIIYAFFSAFDYIVMLCQIK